MRNAFDGPPLSYWAYVPECAQPAATLVLIHGSARDTGRMFRAFLPTAMARNIPIVIPSFPASTFRGYQRLAGAAGPQAARLAMDGTLRDALNVLGIATARVTMCGFSGGAQFAHRYALFSPHRVRRLVVASAGYYTYLEADRRYPYGIGPSVLRGDTGPDVEAFLRVPMRVLVGEQDIERTPGLRSGPTLDGRQGSNRLTRALGWVDHLESVAASRHVPSKVSFDLLPGTPHSFSSAVHRGHLVTRVVDFLHPPAPASRGVQHDHQGMLT
jgi:pimeloyl-ACP methyl ester carboxylesterase